MSNSHSRRDGQPDTSGSRGAMHYRHLLVMAGASFLVMYGLMYAMVDSFANVFANLNQAYMAGLMTAPMILIELVVMRMMYTNRRLNLILAMSALVLLAGCWIMIRQQTLISDRQFLRSMIPHHAGAILMCQQASVSDPDLKALCRTIIQSQETEIDVMKTKLAQVEQ